MNSARDALLRPIVSFDNLVPMASQLPALLPVLGDDHVPRTRIRCLRSSSWESEP